MGLALIGGGFWLLYLAFLLPNAWVGVIGGIAILAGTSTLTFFKRL